MAVSRVVTSQRWCRRHVPYFAVGVAILLVQVVLGYLFYLAPSSESDSRHLPAVRAGGGRTPDSQASNGREQSAQSDDEYNNDDDDGAQQRGESRRSGGAAVPPDPNGSTEVLNWAQLGFQPECDIVEKDALSAIRRATTTQCKQELANVTCLVQRGRLYPSELPRSCDGLAAAGEITKREILWPLAPSSARSLKPARIAFLLSVNGRAVRQVLRLLQLLYHERHVFYIHVDARQQHMYRSLLALESRYGNVRVARDRLATIWGGSSLLEMLLQGMAYLLREHPSWDYFVNLSETDYPIKSREELEKFLAANMGANFVKSHGQDTQRFIGKQALERTFHECGGRMWRLGPRTLPWGLRLDGGSDWVALHRDFCSYVALPVHRDRLVQGLRALFRHTLLPAESFFHTVLQNSRFCRTVADQNLRLVNWKRRQGCQCQHRHVVDWCGCSPNVFRPDDWPRIQATRDRPVFFARKFESVVSRRILDQVDVWVSELRPYTSVGPAVPPTGYWQSEYDDNDGAAPEDDKLTVYESLARLGDRHLGPACALPHNRTVCVDAVQLYFFGDQFQGLLVSYEAGGVSFEAHVGPVGSWQPGSQGTAASPALARLRLISVGTDYDPKEQLVRDFARIMGPESSPGVLHSWHAGESMAVTIVWVDPAKVVAGSYEIQVEPSQQTLFHRPEFRKPLRPGAWTVLLFYEWSLVAQTRFLVSPVAYRGGKKLTSAAAASAVNGGPRGPYIDHDLSRVEEHLGYSRETRDVLRAQSDDDGRLVGRDLERWIDALTAQFWTFRAGCVVARSKTSRSCEALTLCRESGWSSFWPDPTLNIASGA